jgi:hypothetical protein
VNSDPGPTSQDAKPRVKPGVYAPHFLYKTGDEPRVEPGLWRHVGSEVSITVGAKSVATEVLQISATSLIFIKKKNKALDNVDMLINYTYK